VSSRPDGALRPSGSALRGPGFPRKEGIAAEADVLGVRGTSCRASCEARPAWAAARPAASTAMGRAFRDQARSLGKSYALDVPKSTAERSPFVVGELGLLPSTSRVCDHE
jgi:hypothetical protein